jgi:polyisoprenoid-binding protein YceI
MKPHVKFSFVAVPALTFGLAGLAQAAFTASKDAHVTFTAAGPAGMKIEGTTADLKVTEAQGSVVVAVPLGNLATGIALRDHHMKDKYLEVAKFPDATLTVARAALKVPATQADAPATLTLHGQTHAVTVHYDAAPEGDGVVVHGKLHLKMDEYGIAVPSYLGVTVKPDVDVAASFHASGT